MGLLGMSDEAVSKICNTLLILFVLWLVFGR